MTRSTRFWAILLGGIFAAAAVAAALIMNVNGAGRVARIEVDGEVVRKIDLTAVTGEERFDVETPWGRNTIEVRPGGIRVAEADCPDGVCVNQGWLEGGYAPIVCLPHKLAITLESGGDELAPDVITG